MIYQIRARWKCDGCGVRAVSYAEGEGIVEPREPFGWLPGRELGTATCDSCTSRGCGEHVYGATVIERNNGFMVKSLRCEECGDIAHEEYIGD